MYMTVRLPGLTCLPVQRSKNRQARLCLTFVVKIVSEFSKTRDLMLFCSLEGHPIIKSVGISILDKTRKISFSCYRHLGHIVRRPRPWRSHYRRTYIQDTILWFSGTSTTNRQIPLSFLDLACTHQNIGASLRNQR